jgi:D-glycero-beta-D-manno-heptose 1-phosphate adenylyltransferase
VVTGAALDPRVAALPRPLVFTNGCFDLLHRGHVDYLHAAAALGRSLVVGINTDASVARLGKAPGRPVVPLEDRMAVVAGLGCVALVTAFDEDTPTALIRRIRPDVLVKGGDWAVEAIVGAHDVRGWGGVVRTVAVRYPRSTSALIARIRALPAA